MKFLIPLAAVLAAVSAVPAQVGCRHKIDPTNSDLGVAESQISNQFNSMYSQKIVRVLEAESQIVSGVMYHIKFELGQTGCLKSELEAGKGDAKSCDVKDHIQQCEARILSQPWLKNTQVTHVQCQQPQTQIDDHDFKYMPLIEGDMKKITDHLVRYNKDISKVIGGANYFVSTKVLHGERFLLYLGARTAMPLYYRVRFQMTETPCSMKADFFPQCQEHLIEQSIKTCSAILYESEQQKIHNISCN